MNIDPNEFLWAQKYRPRKINDCILPAATKKMVNDMVARGEISHLLFTGGPGMGKTTLAYCIAEELGSDIMYINASLENGIDVLRTKIQSFASTVSLSDSGPKLVILDEADGLTPVLQGALKGFLEAFSSNCRFIFTANLKHKLIEPLHSRCTVVDFRIDPDEKKTLMASFYKRVLSILDQQNVEFEPKVVAKLVERNFPDFRKTLNELQRYGVGGKIDSGILVSHGEDNFKELVKYLKEKNYKEVRGWVAKNEDIEASTLFRTLYDMACTQMAKDSVPKMVLTLADYQYKAAFVADQQINTSACLLELIIHCDWE